MKKHITEKFIYEFDLEIVKRWNTINNAPNKDDNIID
jgi:hypothetical protein